MESISIPNGGIAVLMIGIFAAIVALVFAWSVSTYNRFVRLKNMMAEAWSGFDVQVKRRVDLIPNLVATVQGYRDYERQTQAELAALRNEMAATPPGVSGPDYSAVGQIVAAVAERYPDLKADTAFAALQKNLVDTEQRIALARGYFNDIATQYNTRLETVPERYVARLGAMKPQTLMAANDFERAPVRIGDVSEEAEAPPSIAAS